MQPADSTSSPQGKALAHATKHLKAHFRLYKCDMDPGYFRYSRVICLVLEHERFEVKEDDAGRILAGVWAVGSIMMIVEGDWDDSRED